eukprot:SAG22_NODE_5551_length_994_cov_1.324022_2_plen_91_part_01
MLDGDLMSAVGTRQCVPVACNTVDNTAAASTTVPSRCACAAGYSGTITAAVGSDTDPYFTGSCDTVTCPANSRNDGSTGTAGVAGGCTCSV